jgi:hypothetical protein
MAMFKNNCPTCSRPRGVAFQLDWGGPEEAQPKTVSYRAPPRHPFGIFYQPAWRFSLDTVDQTPRCSFMHTNIASAQAVKSAFGVDISYV